MTRVNLVGPADDGLHLVVETDDGDQFELPIDDELRHAVRYARPKATPHVEHDPGTLSPREIQQRIRAGLTAAELAEVTGMALDALEKFEPPVMAERAYIAELAQSTRIGRDPSSPLLGDLVLDRLAGRGVDVDTVVWDAWREVDEPWALAVDFGVDGRTVRAQWAFDHSTRSVTAEDDESRWLTETELLDVPIPRRHLSAVRGDDARPLPESRPVVPHADAAEAAEIGEVGHTEALLDDLDGRRGKRETILELDLDVDDEFEGFGPASKARSGDVGFAANGRTTPTERATTPAAKPSVDKRTAPPAKRGRASVPSWDEIVFGAKHDVD